MKNNLKYVEKVTPILSKRMLISHTGRTINKRKAKTDEVIINQFLIPLHNKAKRLKLEQRIAYLIRRKRARLDINYVLTLGNKVIRKTPKMESQLKDGGYELVDNVIVKADRVLLQECQDYEYYLNRLFDEGGQRERQLNFNRYLRKHPLRTPSKTTSIQRQQFIGMDDVHNTLRNIHQQQVNQYRLDIWFGYKLMNIETGEFRDYTPSYNTSAFFEKGSPIVNTSINEVVKDLTCENLIERTKRVSSKWTFDSFVEYVVLVTEIPDVLIGAKINLPEHIKKSRSIIAFESVPNNLCFWFCLAKFLQPEKRMDRIVRVAQSLFKDYYGHCPEANYEGVEIEELTLLERHFKLSINVYNIGEEDQVTLERNSGALYETIINLNLYSQNEINHFSLIIQIHNVTKVVRCGDCGRFFTELKRKKRHDLVCNKGKETMEFIGGVFQPKATVFQDMEDIGIVVPHHLRFFPFFLFYDFETYLIESTSDKQANSNLQILGEHQLLSISVIGSEEEQPTFIPVTGTTLEALKEMLKVMDEVRKRYIQKLYPLYTIYFQQLAQIEDHSIRKSLTRRLGDFLEELPVFGFNSGRYDLNVIKMYLPTLLLEQTEKKYGNVSLKEKMWLQTVEAGLETELEHNHKLGRYIVDGFDPTTNTVYEYLGCFFHGCGQCYAPNDINPMTGQKMSELLEKTNKKTENLIKMGYTVVSKWDCQFNAPPSMELTGIVKQNNAYKMISNGRFSFRDLMAYLAPATSFDSFLKAFDTAVPKGRFCHYLTSNVSQYIKENPHLKHLQHNVIHLLKESPIPERRWFFNDLTNTSLEIERYNEIKSKYNNIYDLLVDYNNNDVVPAVEATKKLVEFFKKINLDIHKSGISISGLALKYLWSVKDEDADFHLFKGDEDLYYKFRQNLVGGPSIIFNHYQEKDKTKIRGLKGCKSIQGFDANSLYTYCLGQNMLVGEHNYLEPYPELLDDIKNDNFFGLVEADIEVPIHLREFFQDFQPVFRNATIKYEDLSKDTQEQVDTSFQTTKLIGSFKGEKMLFITDLLKWYLKHGLIVSNIKLVVRYERKAPFKNFVNQITTARRRGDISPEYKLIGEMNKLLANSCYGKTLQNSAKFEQVSIITEDKLVKNLKHPNYKTHSDLHKGYEFRFKKMNHKQDIPVQIGFCVYQLAKLRMLEFYYDMLDHYIDRSDYQAVMCDTDSLYIALTDVSLDVLVKPELREEYESSKHLWFGRVDTKENQLFDMREPGLFKKEFSGTGIIALSSKCYFAYGDGKEKLSSKGLNKKQNILTKERYLQALEGDVSQKFSNKGFRIKNNKIVTYTQSKSGLRLWNDKRRRVGYETHPIEI